MSTVLRLLACWLTQQVDETNPTNGGHVEPFNGVSVVPEGGAV